MNCSHSCCRWIVCRRRSTSICPSSSSLQLSTLRSWVTFDFTALNEISDLPYFPYNVSNYFSGSGVVLAPASAMAPAPSQIPNLPSGIQIMKRPAQEPIPEVSPNKAPSCPVCQVSYMSEVKLMQHKRTSGHGLTRQQMAQPTPSQDFAIPIVDLNQPGVRERLLNCGIRRGNCFL
ncbi:unnamed protein product [Nesidiocoris tenuis]|uniref:C2H2-type domain-containing protein n=1 Tax=Nesidiocoris tenuis TaxID=355587 RepID=A0A6H5GMB8_9HEMI|nr:unnamed protein product [Nesidiocoris tenuis]